MGSGVRVAFGLWFLSHQLIGDIRIGVHFPDIVTILQGIHETRHLLTTFPLRLVVVWGGIFTSATVMGMSAPAMASFAASKS